MRRLISFLSGLAIGALVGATLGLLLAPSSGEELRSNVQNRYGTMQEDVRSAASERRVQLEQQLESLRASRRSKAG